MSKRLINLTLAFALCATAPFAVAQEQKGSVEATKAARLTISEPVKDFGTVPKGSKLDWNFTVKNTGASDLEILSVQPTCGCTVAEYDRVIKPGQSGKITAHVDTTSFQGPISKTVNIRTNDPAAPNATLTMSAIVKPYVDAYPAALVRYNMVQGETSKQSVLIYTEETEPFEIVKIESPQEWIHVEKIKAAGEDLRPVGKKDQAQYVLDITVGGPDARVGPIAEKIHIVTNSKHQPDYWVSVSGVIRPSYRVEPSSVNFGEVTPTAAEAKRAVVIRSNSLKTPEAFVVTKAESGVAGVKVGVTPGSKAGEYMLNIELANDAKAGALDGNITVYTSDVARPTVVIPVKGTVKSGS